MDIYKVIKMKKNIKISVGICAYNEEKNIQKVVEDILSQHRSGWEIAELLVYCDGCTDNTVEILKRIRNKLITLVIDKKRRGKTYRIGRMFNKFSGDILVMFDADIHLKNKNVITNLIHPFLSDNDVMLTGGNSRPLSPNSFFEKAVFATFSVFYKSRKYVNQGNNVFGATGSILAIRKKMAREIKLPRLINEDAFIYLFCLSKKFKFKYVDEAVVFYKLPKNITDYIKQVFRSDPRAVTLELKSYFGNLADKEFHRPFKFYLKSIIETFIENPLGVIVIVLINIFCKAFIPVISKNYKLEWFTAKSTH